MSDPEQSDITWEEFFGKYNLRFPSFIGNECVAFETQGQNTLAFERYLPNSVEMHGVLRNGGLFREHRTGEHYAIFGETAYKRCGSKYLSGWPATEATKNCTACPAGTSTDLMPTLLGMFDTLLDTNKNIPPEVQKTPYPQKPFIKKSSSNFTNLSPTVQKMLANISDQNKNIESYKNSEEYSNSYEQANIHTVIKYLEGQKCLYPANRVQKLHCKGQKNNIASHLNKSSECLTTICDNATLNVQKILSNVPDQDLVVTNCLEGVKRHNDIINEYNSDNNTFLHNKHCREVNNASEEVTNFVNNSYLYNNISSKNNQTEHLQHSESANILLNNSVHDEDKDKLTNITASPKLNSSFKFKSRTSGSYLQIPHMNNKTNIQNGDKEASRPVSCSSLGSCSSSGSSGPNQPSSMYLASTESLDSDAEPNGSQGSADSGIAENAIMSPEQRVLQEVLQTESVYVTDLKQVIQGYLDFWRTTPGCPLIEHLNDLFSNIEEIYEFNRSFLNELYEAENNSVYVAETFIRNDDGFKIYTEYCTDYPKIMSVLSDLTRDSTTAHLIRERQIALGHALPLGSYLLKPVQRILKYHLLLQRLAKLCDNSQKQPIELALATMTSIAGHINLMKGRHEHAVRVQEIQSQLYGWTGADLTGMELCAEGTFRVGGARGYRHVFLFDKVLLITKSKSDGALAYKFHIMCSNLMLVESVRGEPLSFHVLPFDNPRHQVTLRAKSLDHKREWTLQLKRVILENYNAVIPSHARQLVMQLGQDVSISNDSSVNDKWSPLKQHSTPQYLERRTRVRKSRNYSDRRAASHDRAFASLAAWRRKSEPIVTHYNTKTLPKKITKIKKAKDQTAKFYTDLSDSEVCDIITESNDSLAESKDEETTENDVALASNTLEQVVSQLLMQNQEFQKILNRQKKVIKDESNGGIWLKQSICDKPKSDSLPRSFQLNEEAEKPPSEQSEDSKGKLNESETSSILETNDDEEELYPDHKIYRKSTIRFSLVQRFRAIISENTQHSNKLPTYKQGSELMGAKIAQADYADPQKLFNSLHAVNSSPNLQGSLKSETDSCNGSQYLKSKLEDVCTKNNGDSNTDKKTFSDKFLSSSQIKEISKSTVKQLNSYNEVWKSQDNLDSGSTGADSYYEEILDSNLNIDDASNRVLYDNTLEKNKNSKNLSETNTKEIESSKNSSESQKTIRYKRFENDISIKVSSDHVPLTKVHTANSKLIKRPMKPPPPIPAKPARIFCSESPNNAVPNTKGWVKTVVGRFE